jgi:PHD/YefM family antitoxin component YafN of YafNO toxin-antitoxin module
MTCDDLVEEVRGALREVREQVRAELEPLTVEQLAWQPAPERWGAGHCLVHLRDVGTHSLPEVRGGLDRARRKGTRKSAAPYRPGWLGRRLAEGMTPGSGVSLKTPARFRPSTVPGTVVSDHLEHLARYEALLEQAHGLDLSAVRVASPSSRLIRLRLADMLLLLANHERRHVRQALDVLAEPGFPGPAPARPGP